ncbi:MAG: hypothetical protein IH948_02195, partial [Bacteroidetes bacterium]|nr:hypothetical protein [Bacteroidota bacterium]
MDALKKHVFPNVELRATGNLFNQLTVTLDRLLVKAFNEINPGRHACSINLNVESVFTKAFEEFLGEESENNLGSMVFEFRQENILQQFDQFEIATNLIKSRGGTICVDAIFPETVGLVNLNRLGAAMAKIFWRPGAEEALPQRQDEIKRMNKKSNNLFHQLRIDYAPLTADLSTIHISMQCKNKEEIRIAENGAELFGGLEALANEDTARYYRAMKKFHIGYADAYRKGRVSQQTSLLAKLSNLTAAYKSEAEERGLSGKELYELKKKQSNMKNKT